ncbi:MAG: AMP-binding protein, partial [Gemmatimonadetes bacterium]|nr:AMP-binding protein [Gemmatimonadota bacterium]
MGVLLHHSVDESARRDPAHEAFRFRGAGMSYESLARRATQLANLLIEDGVRPSDRVGIYMNKSLELPVALYGILKAGAAYVPVDPSSPASRVEFIARDCELRHVITDSARARQTLACADRGGDIRCIVSTGEPIAGEGDVRVRSWADLDG